MLAPFDILINGTWNICVEGGSGQFCAWEVSGRTIRDYFPGEYMIFSQTTGNKVVVKDGLPEPGAASDPSIPVLILQR
jgi:hypothetical protein